MPEIDVIKAKVDNLEEDLKEFKRDTVKNFDILYATTKESNKEIQDLKISIVELNGNIKNMSKSMENFTERVDDVLTRLKEDRENDCKRVDVIKENLDVEMKKIAQEEIEKKEGTKAKKVVATVGTAIGMAILGYVLAVLGLQ